MLTRRGFLAGSAAVLAVRAQTPPLERPIRAAVFSEPGFPSVDIAPLGREALASALSGFEVAWVSETELADLRHFDILITPYGSTSPKAAWKPILEYLRQGGNWVNLGGVPFSVPVVRDNGEWRQEVRQTAYHKALFITQSFATARRCW